MGNLVINLRNWDSGSRKKGNEKVLRTPGSIIGKITPKKGLVSYALKKWSRRKAFDANLSVMIST